MSSCQNCFKNDPILPTSKPQKPVGPMEPDPTSTAFLRHLRKYHMHEVFRSPQDSAGNVTANITGPLPQSKETANHNTASVPPPRRIKKVSFFILLGHHPSLAYKPVSATLSRATLWLCKRPVPPFIFSLPKEKYL